MVSIHGGQLIPSIPLVLLPFFAASSSSLIHPLLPPIQAAADLATVSRFRKLAHMSIDCPWPFANRDMVIDGYGVDFSEENKILVNVRSIDSSPHCVIPAPSTGVVRSFMYLGGFLIEPINESRCRLSFMVNIDLKMDYVPAVRVCCFAAAAVAAAAVGVGYLSCRSPCAGVPEYDEQKTHSCHPLENPQSFRL